MRQRNPGSCRCRREAAYAGNDLVRNLGGFQDRYFFAAASENERVTTLEPANNVALPRVIDHEIVDRGLLFVLVPEAFTRIDYDRFRARLSEKVEADQP